MNPDDPRLLVQPAPFLHQTLTTSGAMRDVLVALAPLVVASVWLFGLSAFAVMIAGVAGAVVTEWAFPLGGRHGESLRDGSAVLTGLLLALTLPPTLPLWMAFLGGVASIGFGKLVWGGLGHNLFNPALVGRAFLSAAFPIQMTLWTPSGEASRFAGLYAGNLSIPFMQDGIDAVTSATPLGLMKFEQVATPLAPLVLGNIAGSAGETSGILILLGGLYLLVRRSFDWRIPAGILVTVAALSTVLSLYDPHAHPGPLFALFSGGLLFGAIYMATDPVTSPVTPRGAWIFGIGIGALVILIRGFGGFPEGVMYAILLMNAASPLIERFTQPRVFGRGGSPR